jgi:hypothetical protein
MAVGDANCLAFSASLRGLLESSADSYECLRKVPLFLAKNRGEIVAAIERTAGNEINLAPGLEDALIHFTHARRLDKGESAQKSHSALATREYLKLLEQANVPLIIDCYSELCQVTHPAAGSIFFALRRQGDETLVVDTGTDAACIRDVANRYHEMMLPLFMFAFNAALLTFRVLSSMPLPDLHTPLSEFQIDRITGWEKLKTYIQGVG